MDPSSNADSGSDGTEVPVAGAGGITPNSAEGITPNGAEGITSNGSGLTAATGDQEEPEITVVDGKSTKNKTKYDIKNKGLFAIVCNTSFNYILDGHDLKEKPLNYAADVESLKKTFSIDDDNFGYNLTCEDPNGSYQFDEFMNKLVKPCDTKYDFVMFILMSHGLEDGKFLLAEERRSEACCGSKDQEVEHSPENNPACHLRDVKKDVIKKIQDSPKFRGIPKIFLIQTCRGRKMDVDLREPKFLGGLVQKSAKKFKKKQPADESSLADEYIPVGSDTYVLFACYDDHMSYLKVEPRAVTRDDLVRGVETVDTDGSLLIKYFCDEVDALRQRAAESKKSKGLKYTCLENLTDGWIENIGQKTLAKVTNKLVIQTIGKQVQYDKQQPEVVSTLRFKLSMIELLRTQRGDL